MEYDNPHPGSPHFSSLSYQIIYPINSARTRTSRSQPSILTPPNAPLHLRINTPTKIPQLRRTPPRPPIFATNFFCHSYQFPATRASKM